MKIDVELKCPYCNKKIWHNAICLDDDGCATTFCWEDEGGCGKEYNVIVESDVSNIKVEIK
jgi:hypothetical protein